MTTSTKRNTDDRYISFKLPDDMNHEDREPALIRQPGPPSELDNVAIPGMVSPVLADLIVAYSTLHKLQVDDIVATLSSVLMRMLAGMKASHRDNLAFYQAMIQVAFENPKVFNVPERKVYYLHPRNKK
jgi:hypothetical protein